MLKEHDKIVRYLENNLNRDNINNAIYLDEYKNYLVNFIVGQWIMLSHL